MGVKVTNCYAKDDFICLIGRGRRICQKRDEGKMFYRIKDIERDRLGDRVRGDKRKEREI